MFKLNKILPNIIHKSAGKLSNGQGIKMAGLYWFSLFTLFFILWFSITSILSNQMIYGFILLGAFFLLLVNLIYTIRKKYYSPGNYLYIIIAGLLILYVLTLEQHETNGIWVSFFPLAIYLLAEKKYRNLISALFVGLVIIVLFLLPVFELFSLTYNFFHRIVMVIAPVGMHLIIFTLDYFYRTEIERMNNEIESAKKKNSEKDSFLSKLSHQVRTLLNNIVVVTNLLDNTTLEKKQKDLIETIQASANNLADAINNISELSKLDVIESIDYDVEFDLFSTISNTLNLFTKQDGAQNLIFDIDAPDDIPRHVIGNPIKIKQIFLNLIENLLKNKSGSNAEFIIRISDQGEMDNLIKLHLEIISSQPIQIQYSKAQRQFITSSRNLQETNLSELINVLDLAIANRLIEQKGGKLEIKNTSNSSAFLFDYTFIKASEEEEKPEEAESFISSKKKPKVALEDSNILLVEDNLINQKIIMLSLKKRVKNIDIANNGKEALDLFGSSKYDLILMDIQMPIMNGLVTAKKIREIEASTNSHTPIIAITANALLGDKENCLAAGMDDYISKPFQIEVLTKKIHEQLEREI